MDNPPHQPWTDDDDSGDISENAVPELHPNEDAGEALDQIRRDMHKIAREFADGAISRAQFNAMYAHYSEKRTIIEKLLERNPETDAWRAAAAAGKTTFLRNRYEAHPMFYLVFAHGGRKPLLIGGRQPPNTAQHIYALLKAIWAMSEAERKIGVARKALDNGLWVVLAIGEHAFTLVIYALQPSLTQVNRVRDLHDDFERANRFAFERRLPPDRMVFTQRSLLEGS